MSMNPSRLDHRLESVERALSLAYQFLLALDHLVEDSGILDSEAVEALTAIVADARSNARIVGDALPVPVRRFEVPDDYEAPPMVDPYPPLQPIIDSYRKRVTAEDFAIAMHGRVLRTGRRRAKKTSAPQCRS